MLYGPLSYFWRRPHQPKPRRPSMAAAGSVPRFQPKEYDLEIKRFAAWHRVNGFCYRYRPHFPCMFIMYVLYSASEKEGSSTRLRKLHPRRCVAWTGGACEACTLAFLGFEDAAGAASSCKPTGTKQTAPLLLRHGRTACGVAACPTADFLRRLTAGYREGHWKGGWRKTTWLQIVIPPPCPPLESSRLERGGCTNCAVQ